MTEIEENALDYTDEDLAPLGKYGVYFLIFIVINIVLWGAQEMYYSEDSKIIVEKTELLRSMESGTIKLEGELKIAGFELESLMEEMNINKELAQMDEYNSKVDIYNSKLSWYNAQYSIYESKIENYNKVVAETNILMEKSGSLIFLVPLPANRIKAKE